MKIANTRTVLSATAFIWLLSGVLAHGLDWPQWRGPGRDGISKEEGLLKQWPAGGPKMLWETTEVGEGYSGPSVVGNLLYVMGNGNGREWLVALDVRTGRQVWACATGPVRSGGGGYAGPRSTPTVDGERVYTLGLAGTLICCNARTGKLLWHVELTQLGGKEPHWGYAESVLIDGQKLLCTPGGRNIVVALDKTTGRPIWSSPQAEPAAYSSLIKVSIGNVDQYVTLTGRGVIGVRAADGRPLWRYDAPSNGTANCPTCVSWGQTVFGASGYGNGGGLAWIRQAGGGFQVQELYFTKKMENHHGGFVLIDGYLYGSSNPGILTCLDYKTGNVMWQSRAPGKCSITYADGMLYCRNENGPIGLCVATPRGFEPRGNFNQPSRSNKKSWPHPVIAGGRLYLRDQGVLQCYDISGR